MKTFEFATPHGRLGTLILEPGHPPKYWWVGRGDCPEAVRDVMTKGLPDPETGEHVAADKGEHFFEVLAVEYCKGRFLVGRKGPDVAAIPPNARKVAYTPGVSAWFKS